MQAFDLFLYALAIITVLLLRAESTPATVATVAQPEPSEAPQPEPAPIADPLPAMAATIAQPAAVAVVKVASQPSTDYAAMKTPQLRQLCSQRGIKWRNAHGTSKHLSKAAMIAALA